MFLFENDAKTSLLRIENSTLKWKTVNNENLQQQLGIRLFEMFSKALFLCFMQLHTSTEPLLYRL